MSPPLLRHLLLASFVLVMVIVVTSAYIRLSQAGLGCADWPACYTQVAQVPSAAVAADSPLFWARAVHRISASVVAIMLVLLVLMGWEGLAGRGAKAAALAVLGLAGFLAWLGRFTPSSVPAVLLGNLLGGMIMGALLWCLYRRGAASVHCARKLAGVALAVVAVQVALGGLIGAHRAALACDALPACNGNWWPEADWRLFNPFIDTAGTAPGIAALQAVAMAHRYGALAVAAVIGWVAVGAIRRGGPAAARGRLLLVLLLAQLLLGAGAVVAQLPLPLVLLHNLGAALLLATTATLLFDGSATSEAN